LVSADLEDVCPTDEFEAVTGTGEFPAVKGERRAGRHRQRRQLPAYRLLPLMVILGVQAGLSLRLIWSNTAFMDEALYLWAGRLEWAHWLHGAPIPVLATYFSGAPAVYPPLGALANDVGGLVAARTLSLLFMLGATVLLYSVAQRLFNYRIAVIAAAVFGFLGPTHFLGALATYDAMAVFLLALAAWLAIRPGGRWGELALIACALSLVLADAAKYASLLWNPVVIALAVLGPPAIWPSTSRARALTAAGRGIRLVVYVVAMVLPLLFLVGGRSYVTGLMFTTISRGIPGTNTPLSVLTAAYEWIGVVFVLALLGFILSLSAGDKRISWLCGILAAAALLAPLNQARLHTVVSLQKHVVFGAWFAAIAVGYAAEAMLRVNPLKGWRVAALALCALLTFGVPQATGMFVVWPNASGMTRELSVALSRSKCPCLISEDSVASYYLPHQLPEAAQITTPYSFYYWDAATRRELVGNPAYEQAIKDGYFGVIEIDDVENTLTYAAVTHALAGAHNYKLLATVPASNQRKPFSIWIRR